MPLSDRKILITGAAGSLGRQLIYEMVKRGIRPIAHLRESSNASQVEALGLERRLADLRNQAELEALVEGVDAIIHTAAWVNFRGDRLTQFTGINTVAACDLFKLAQKAGVKRFVHVSTVAAIGAWRRGNSEERHRSIDEESPFNLERLQIPYIMTKHAAEIELAKLVDRGKTELVTVNPSMIIAPSRSGDDRGKAIKAFGRFIVPELPMRVNLVDLRDVVPGILAALEKGRAGERYILAGDDISVRDLLLAISSVLGRTPHLVRLPRGLFDMAATLSTVISRLLGRSKKSFYPDLVRMLDYDWTYSSRKARTELGYNNRSVFQSLADLLTNHFNDTHLKPRA